MQNEDTDQQLVRTEIESGVGDLQIVEVEAPDQNHRTDEWIDQFETQLTEEMSARVHRFARPHALSVAYAGRKIDEDYIRGVVQDAIGDTWIGRVTWDPAKVSLERHLCRVVQFRTKDDRVHAQEFRPVALGDDTDASRRAESDASTWVAGDVPHAETVAYKNEVMAQLRAEFAKDKPVQRILAAYDRGAKTKAEILEVARMSPRIYNNAYTRIKRFIRRMTNTTLAPKAQA